MEFLVTYILLPALVGGIIGVIVAMATDPYNRR